MAILNRALPVAHWTDPRLARLPGMIPVDPADWLLVDDAYGAQMALRATLLAEQRAAVLAESANHPAAAELLDVVLAALPPLGFAIAAGRVQRPDGVCVAIDRQRPLQTLGHLVQEDFCILERPRSGREHVLDAAILCFPASWTLAEKIGRPLGAIHTPVADYDDTMARRVQRLFDAIRPGQPLMRFNAMRYSDPALFQPRSEADPRPRSAVPGRFLRSERQCLRRLPLSGAVVFSIHTWVVAVDTLPAELLQGFDAAQD